jgi:RNA polymerase sigma-70 factor (ECF subfamily)
MVETTVLEVPEHAHAVPGGIDDRRQEFRSLYRAHFGYVWRTLARYGVPAAQLEDGCQEVFVIVLRRFGSWRERASFRSWLHGVARRVASAQRRHHARHQRKLEALPPVADAPPIEGQLHQRRRLDTLTAAIAELEPKRREVFVLAELEGLSAPEISDALDCKLNTVYSRLRRARADINLAMAAYLGGDDG